MDAEFAEKEHMSDERNRIGLVILGAFIDTAEKRGIDFDPDTCFEAAGAVLEALWKNRPELDFPDSEGPWWVRLCGTYCRVPVWARLVDGALKLSNPVNPGDPSAAMTKEEWANFGGVKVVKCEPCPFEKEVASA